MSQPSNSNNEMSFIDHLEVLRWHLVRGLVAIVLVMIVVFMIPTFVFDVLIFSPKEPYFWTYQGMCQLSKAIGLNEMLCFTPKSFEIVNLQMMGQFVMHLKISAVLGFIVAFPYLLWEAWRFIEPGLYEEERKYSKGIIFISSLLFMIGVCFGYFILSPFSINFFATYSVSEAIQNNIALDSYISIITTLTMASGIMFELPMVVYFLSRLGLLTPDFMRNHRRHAFMIILIISAIITPADVFSQVLVSLPIYVLYELSILVSARVVRKMQRAEKALVKS